MFQFLIWYAGNLARDTFFTSGQGCPQTIAAPSLLHPLPYSSSLILTMQKSE